MNDDNRSTPWPTPAPLPGTPEYVPGGRTGPPPGSPDHPNALWREAFVAELRRLDVSGDRIGSALAEVNVHCADSRETPQEAFGDPVAYARALDLPRTAARGPGALALAAALGGLLGYFTWLKLILHWDEHVVDISRGDLAFVLALSGPWMVLVLLGRRAENRFPVLVTALSTGAFASAAVLAGDYLAARVVTVSWWVLASAATTLLLLNLARHVIAPSREDPVRPPDGSKAPTVRTMSAADRLLRAGEPWALIVLTVGVVGYRCLMA